MHHEARPLDFDRYRSLIRSDARLAAQVFSNADQSSMIPACPDWPMTELRDHMAGTLAFWIQQLRTADADADGPDFGPEVRARYQEPLTNLAEEIHQVLGQSSADSPCWNWSTAPNTAGWAARRMANEIAMHRVDMQSAVGTASITPMAADLAVDGIDEVLTTFAGAEEPLDASKVRVLRIESPSAQWTVDLQQHLGVQPSTSSPEVTVSGAPSDALQFLWGRPATVEIHGEAAVLHTWRSLPVFS